MRRTVLHRLVMALVALALLGLGGALRAAPLPDAVALGQRGDDAYGAGDFEAAATAYQDAYRSSRNPSYLYGAAQSLRKLGRSALAIELYRRYLAEATLDDQARALVEARVAELEAQLAGPAPSPSPSPSPAAAPRVAIPSPTRAPTPAPLAPSAPDPAAPPRSPIYKRWWFWAAVGVVAVGATTAIVLVGADDAASPPAGDHGPYRLFAM